MVICTGDLAHSAAHEDAWVNAKILHRDISCSNIMFVVDQDKETETDLYGILNDWDLCKHAGDLALEQTQSDRSVSCIDSTLILSPVAHNYHRALGHSCLVFRFDILSNPIDSPMTSRHSFTL